MKTDLNQFYVRINKPEYFHSKCTFNERNILAKINICRHCVAMPNNCLEIDSECERKRKKALLPLLRKILKNY